MMAKTFLCLLVLILPSCVFAAPLPAPVAKPAPATPTETVRQFLEARAAGQGDKMQALLSETTPLFPKLAIHLKLDAQDFSQGATPAQAAVLSLLYDPQNKLGFKFNLLVADPDFPNIVRVQATPVTGPPLTLQVVVEPDPSAADALRVDELLTINCADPRIMLPIVVRLREHERQAASRQHLHQLGLAFIQYVQDHDETMPDAAHWVDELMPYVMRDASVFHDPSTPLAQKWGYAYNKNLSGKSIAMLQFPASTATFYESTAGVKNASDTGESVPRPDRHRGGTDYAFADGHVKWYADGAELSYNLSGK